MTRKIVYIAAPFGASSQTERVWNTQRAELLCLLAQRSGYAPICVHSGILRGAYGDDDNPADRAAGLETDVRLLDVCDEMWVLLRDDGSMSDGVAVEVKAYGAPSEKQHMMDGRTWDDWGGDMISQGLAERWADLRRAEPQAPKGSPPFEHIHADLLRGPPQKSRSHKEAEYLDTHSPLGPEEFGGSDY